jgi:hypothetical protein
MGVLRRMGLLDEIRRRQAGTGEVAVIDEAGTPLLRLPADFMSGEESTFRTDRGYYIAGTRRMNTPAMTTLVNGLLDVGHREVEDRERCRCVVGLGVDQHVPTTAGAGQ